MSRRITATSATTACIIGGGAAPQGAHHRLRPRRLQARRRRLPHARLRYPYIAFVPQWDFLDLLTSEARHYPSFRLLMRSKAIGLLREHGRVVGVRYRDPDGEHEIRSHLTVAADGRRSPRGRAGNETLRTSR